MFFSISGLVRSSASMDIGKLLRFVNVYRGLTSIVNVDIFACINFGESMKIGNFART